MIELVIPFIFICIFIIFLLPLLFFRRKYGEAKVANKLEVLQRENNEYNPFNNVILKTPDGTTQIDHILISPYGIFVIETKEYKGWIFGGENQKTWTQSLIGPRYSSTKYQFYNPIRQNFKHVKAVQSFFGVNAKNIFNVVVFVGNSTFKTAMPENVLVLRELLAYIRCQTRILFTSETVEKLSQKLSNYIEHAPSEEDHFKNIENNRIHPICPSCGKQMVLRTARKGDTVGSKFWGCPNFPECRVTKNAS